MNSRKYPRTLVEAFGPYAQGPVHAPDEPESTAAKLTRWACALAAVVVVGAVALGGA